MTDTIIHVKHEGKDSKYEVLFSKRSGLIPIGSRVMTLTDDGFLRLKIGYFFKREYQYCLRDATIQEEDSYFFTHRITLDLKTPSGRQPLQLPLYTGKTFAGKLHECMNDANAKISREGENAHGFPPKRKITDTILCLLIIAVLFFGFCGLFGAVNGGKKRDNGTASDSGQQVIITETTVKETDPGPEEETVGKPAEEKQQSVGEFVGSLWNTTLGQVDRESVWNAVMPHVNATSDLALTVGFAVILLLLIGLFLPGKAIRFVTLFCILVCIGVSVYVAYNIDFTEGNVLQRVLFAIAPMLVALIVAVVFDMVGKALKTRKYNPMIRVGYLLAFVLTAVSLWIFAYGYLNGYGFTLPSVYPEKIFQLGQENAYIYVSAGVIALMLIVCAILKAGKFAGTLGSISALAMAGHVFYEAASRRRIESVEEVKDLPREYLIPVCVFLGVWILSLIVKSAGRKHIVSK